MASRIDRAALADLRLAELSHRTANVLQMIGGLLRRAAARTADRRAADALLAAEAQIAAFALLGAQLHSRDEPACAAAYLDGLADHLETACLRPRGIALRRDLPPALPLDPAGCRALGLVVVEAVINAVKHAFGEAGGMMSIALAPSGDGGCNCTVADDGSGYPPDASAGQGTQFMAMLARTAGGGCSAETGPGGTTIHVSIGRRTGRC